MVDSGQCRSAEMNSSSSLSSIVARQVVRWLGVRGRTSEAQGRVVNLVVCRQPARPPSVSGGVGLC